jgi:hypothetical protein
MTQLQKMKRQNRHLMFCHNCLKWYDCRDLGQVLPHLFCSSEENLQTGMEVPEVEWTESVCEGTGEVYKNPDPITNPLLRKQIDRGLLRKINLRMKHPTQR